MGFEAARALLEHGVQKLALFDTNSSSGVDAARSLTKGFPESVVLFKKVNVTDPDDVNTAVHQVVEAFGRLDILLAFAGIVKCEHALDMSMQAWQRVLDVNLTGSFLCAQAVARYESKKKKKKFIPPSIFLLPFPGSDSRIGTG